MSPPRINETSYRQHAESMDAVAGDAWPDDASVDQWRHQRMYEQLAPLLGQYPRARWLTVGDGRGGLDARYLWRRGADVHASDISERRLERAHREGRIPSYSRQNLEALDFEDDAFDFVLCKETLHHLPRPMIGLYEMIRVARIGAILIEPNDPYTYRGVMDAALRWTKDRIKPLRGMSVTRADYEEVGNFVYAVSERELEKVAAGIGCRAVATRGLNDHYEPGLGANRATDSDPVFRRVRRQIRWLDALSSLGLKKPGYSVAIVLPDPPDPALRKVLLRAGFTIIDLPPHPMSDAG
jgi:ubiquinone/menaquinone biosynthesis C-methylase UbiE